MITATSSSQSYCTNLTDGVHANQADAPADLGGGTAFTPSALLESALAACVNIVVRMYAERNNISLRGVKTRVELAHDAAEATVFRYAVDLDGDLTNEQRQKLEQVALACPIRRALSKPIRFEALR